MIRAVLDTNVVVSASLSSDGPAALILDSLFSKSFRCFISEALLDEYEQVLSRPRFARDPREILRAMRHLRKTAVVVVPAKRVAAALDPDDNKLLDCALEARADYIVTWNVRHFPKQFQDIRIVRPRQFLTILASDPHLGR